MEEPAVRGLAIIRNHCTIAHIATLLVAKAAAQLGVTECYRFIWTFVPDVVGG